ncbi:MAG: OmpH family outer membrane protein [Desulfobulbaceae bacterium]|nr:OmpH family outer membrane protein [Desulfobulbaceae bacterium]
MTKNLLSTLCVCLTILLFLAQPVLSSDTGKIATMNLQKVLAISKAGQTVKSAVTKKFDAYQEKLQQQEKSLIALKGEIEKKSSAWSEAVKTKKEREFKRRVTDLEEESQYAANDMKEFEQEQVGPILKALEEIIVKYGKEKGYSLILDTSKGILYQDEAIDISGDLAAELDKRLSEKNK